MRKSHSQKHGHSGVTAPPAAPFANPSRFQSQRERHPERGFTFRVPDVAGYLSTSVAVGKIYPSRTSITTALEGEIT